MCSNEVENTPRVWPRVRIGEVAEVFDGPHATPTKTMAGPVFLGISALNRGRLDLSNTEHLSEDEFVTWTRRVTPRSGDVVFSYETRIGEAAIIPDGLRCCLGRRMGLVRADPSKLDPHFFLYQYLSPAFQDFLTSRTIHGSTVDRIALKEFPDFEIDLPPLAVQRHVAQVMADVDAKGDINLRINQTLEAMAQAIFKSWFVDFDPVKAKIAAIQDGRDPLCAAMSAISGKSDAELDALQPEQYDPLAATAALFPDEMEESELGPIPKAWSHKALAQLTDKIGSGATPRGGKEVYLADGVALIRSQNVYDSLFVWEGLARISDEAATQLKGVAVQEDDVLLNITGASILRTCVVETDVLPARVNQHVAIIRAKAGVPSRFIHMHLLRPDIKSYLLGLNAGASREAITKAHIESLTLLTPSPELLAAFQTATDPLFRQVQRFGRQMRVLGELRDALLPKLLSGELSVEALADPVGEA
ncbi:restriction endonuclease subunit S [Thauera sp. 2A1]|uniref:restriction endonuclease subunit S n=1 Tax=Thauera sp. 2A1 TaxID=2570191 RepID=UPI0012925446|nr:restriction endonuclease subunit S [Thauera sp. 2A1]KAI5915692.1 restriction endonuclease subunit S [Thauera sp. 2A1]